MKIILPNGERLVLDENITLDEKIKKTEELTDFWMQTILTNWNSNAVIFFLDNLSNYLIWHKEEEDKNKQDKEILSIKKIEQMTGKRKANSIAFSNLSKKDSEKLFGESGGKQ